MFVAVDKVHILLQNVDQIKAIISATFGSNLWHAILENDCTAPSSDAEELACEYRTMIAESGHAAAHGNVELSQATISKVYLLIFHRCSLNTNSSLVVAKSPRCHEQHG